MGKKLFISDNNALHFTHNDADAIGCALVVEMYGYYLSFLPITHDKSYNTNEFINHEKTDYILQQVSFNSIGTINTNITKFLDYMDRFTTGADWTDEETGEFQLMTIGSKYNDLDLLMVPRYIIISDVPVDVENMIRLYDLKKKFGIRVIYFDHHKSNSLLEYVDTDWYKETCYISTYSNRELISATWLMREYFFRPLLSLITDKKKTSALDITDSVSLFYTMYYDILENYFNEIDRYDTWKWKTDPIQSKTELTEYQTTALIWGYNDLGKTFKAISSFFKCEYREFYETSLNPAPLTNNHMLRLYPIFDTIITHYDELKEGTIKQKLKSVVYFNAHEIPYMKSEYVTCKVAMFICPDSFSNDCMEAIYKQADHTIDIVIGLFPNSRTISFRRGTNRVDLANFAKLMYNGGGHAAAAGARLSTDDFLKFMRMYYDKFDEKLKNQ